MLDLIMAIHCHQPVGNFDHVFAMAHAKCYRPLLDLLEAYPKVRLGLHLSGPLLEWLDANRPETLDLVRRLVEREQVEPLSGGFYEPLLTTIPVQDARGQVLRMNDFLQRRLGRMPTGFWLTERIWDTSLPLTLQGTGMAFTILDDTHFLYAGLKPGEIDGIYITEKEGQALRLLATPMVMRYMIPFKPVPDVMRHLYAWYESGRCTAVYGDDGEKFGLWPKTYEWVFQQGWLERFFAAIEANDSWLRTTPPGEYAAAAAPRGRIYLPPASYQEMTQWALPPDLTVELEEMVAELKREGRWTKWEPFVRGGIWDNFMVKYDETNRMHKKMLFLSPRVAHHPPAREALWKAQCNCGYWHGVFGGLYLAHLRRAIHDNLLIAQTELMHAAGDALRLKRTDYDMDGRDEILIAGRDISLGLAPAQGGGLFEIAYLPRPINLSDVLTRRKEAYHRRLFEEAPPQEAQADGNDIASIHDIARVQDETLRQALIYDSYPRISLLDHFLPLQTDPAAYASNRHVEWGDFVTGEYATQEARISDGAACVTLSREGIVENIRAEVCKSIRTAANPKIDIHYRITSLGRKHLSALYGSEFNLMLYSDQDPERFYQLPETTTRLSVGETARTGETRSFELVNGADRLTTAFRFSRPVSVWCFPLMTVSQSEQGFEKTYQGSSLLFTFALELNPGESQELSMELELIDLK